MVFRTNGIQNKWYIMKMDNRANGLQRKGITEQMAYRAN